jgi:hypothetical protein
MAPIWILTGFLRPGRGFLLPLKGRRCHVATVKQRPGRSQFMSDFIFIGAMAGFFVIAGLYVRFCDKL